MNKRLPLSAAIALLLLGADQAALAQAQITTYGKVDLGLRQSIGDSRTGVATSGDSRLGFRGTEDLGGGLQAFFGIEHRFFADTGMQDGSQTWKGYSIVGLQGGFGRVALGRQYTAAFSLVQHPFDPFEGDTVAAVREVGNRVGGITKVRVDGSLRYDITFSGLTLAASIAEATKNGGPDRPLSVAARYRTGDLTVAAGFEDPAGAEDKQWNLGGAYVLAGNTLSAGFAKGTTNAGLSARGWMLGLNAPLGAGEFKAALATQRVGGSTTAQKLGLGYHHALSKRTLIYVDAGHDRKAAGDKTGYDLGIRHTF